MIDRRWRCCAKRRAGLSSQTVIAANIPPVTEVPTPAGEDLQQLSSIIDTLLKYWLDRFKARGGACEQLTDAESLQESI